jgi:uncharacterized protein (DUF58 family)
MWFKTIFKTKRASNEVKLFDEAFLLRLERLSLQAQRTLRGNPSSGEHPSRHHVPASVFSDHRPYSVGDDYRYIDWNSYGHQEQLFVKLGEVEQDVHVHVMLDVSRSMAWGSPTKLRVAQQLAAALGYLALSHSDRLHVVPFGTAPLRKFGPAQGKNRLPELMRFIEAVQPNERTALARAIRTYAKAQTMGGMLVLISDLLATEGMEEALRLLVPPRWQVLVLHVIDQRELQPDFQGPIELEDAETGQRLALTLDSETLSAYRQQVRTWQEQIASLCARRGATYAPVLTNWSLERMVVPYLQARRILR